jgi:hypothetical protein
MSKTERCEVKTNQNLFNRVVAQPLENFFTAAFKKLKHALTQENTLNGIQFYGDLDD